MRGWKTCGAGFGVRVLSAPAGSGLQAIANLCENPWSWSERGLLPSRSIVGKAAVQATICVRATLQASGLETVVASANSRALGAHHQDGDISR